MGVGLGPGVSPRVSVSRLRLDSPLTLVTQSGGVGLGCGLGAEAGRGGGGGAAGPGNEDSACTNVYSVFCVNDARVCRSHIRANRVRRSIHPAYIDIVSAAANWYGRAIPRRSEWRRGTWTRWTVNVFGALAQYERAQISERVISGLVPCGSGGRLIRCVMDVFAFSRLALCGHDRR